MASAVGPSVASVLNPRNYPWSSHRNYMQISLEGIVDRDFILAMFEKDIKKAITRFDGFVLERLGGSKEKHLHKMIDQRFLGDEEFVGTIRLKFDDMELDRLELKRNTSADLKDILAPVARHFQLGETDIVSATRSRKVAFARHVFIYIAREEFNTPGRKVAKFLKRDDSSISLVVRQMRERLSKDPTLKVMIDDICSRFVSEGFNMGL